MNVNVNDRVTVIQSRVVIATVCKLSESTYGFASPLSDSNAWIRFHTSQAGAIAFTPGINVLQAFRRPRQLPNVGDYLAIIREDESPSDNGYTIAAFWFIKEYFDKIVRKFEDSKGLVLSDPRDPSAVELAPAHSTERQKGEHFSRYREKKKLRLTQ